MNLSAERVEALTLAIVDGLEAATVLRINDRRAAVQAVSARLTSALGKGDGLDRAVRAKIASLSRDVPEGGREWDILYRQYLEEERRKS
jgi:hypothetical protein